MSPTLTAHTPYPPLSGRAVLCRHVFAVGLRRIVEKVPLGKGFGQPGALFVVLRQGWLNLDQTCDPTRGGKGIVVTIIRREQPRKRRACQNRWSQGCCSKDRLETIILLFLKKERGEDRVLGGWFRALLKSIQI